MNRDVDGRAKLRVSILISGRGSNMTAIAGACAEQRIRAEVVRVISDRASAEGIVLAARLGLDTRIIAPGNMSGRDAFEEALARSLDECGTELVALAGFMRILSPDFVQRYAGRLLNIHPSLLPRHKGLHTHRNVLLAGDREHGASVHWVTAELDGGPVICQARLAVLGSDSEHSLESRVLRLEHRIYPQVIGLIAAGRLELRGDTVVLDGRALATPLQEDEAHGLQRASG